MESRYKMFIGIIGLIAMLLLLTPFADPNPDGLESAVGEDTPEGTGFELGLLSGYGGENSILFKILGNEFLSVIISGVIGFLIVTSVFLVPLILKRKERTAKPIK